MYLVPRICNNKVMSDTKLLQTILDKVSSVDKKIDTLGEKVDKRFNKVDKRLDTIGMSVARLEDDSPTIEEFDGLEKRVNKLEKQTAST